MQGRLHKKFYLNMSSKANLVTMSGVLREPPGPKRVEISDIPLLGKDFEFRIPVVLDVMLLLSMLPEGYDLPEDVILTGNKCWLNSLLFIFVVNGVQVSRVQADYLVEIIRRSNDLHQNPAVLDIAKALGTTSFQWVIYEVLVSAGTCINLTELNGGHPIYIINNATDDGQIDSHWYVVLPEGSPLVTRFSSIRAPIVRDARGFREARAARSAPVAQGKGAARVPPVDQGKGAARVAPVAQGNGGKGKELDEFEAACKASEASFRQDQLDASEASFRQDQLDASELLAVELESLEQHNRSVCASDRLFALSLAGKL